MAPGLFQSLSPSRQLTGRVNIGLLAPPPLPTVLLPTPHPGPFISQTEYPILSWKSSPSQLPRSQDSELPGRLNLTSGSLPFVPRAAWALPLLFLGPR